MDKSQIQKRTKELLEKAEKPTEFTRGLQELLKSYVDRDATKNHQRIIPDTGKGKFFGAPLGTIEKSSDLSPRRAQSTQSFKTVPIIVYAFWCLCVLPVLCGEI